MHPAAMALRGIPSYRADSGSWANEMPPAALTALQPSVPSLPVPDMTTATAWLPFTSASVRRNRSTGMCRPSVAVRAWRAR